MTHSIDTLIMFVKGLRASRGGHQNADAAWRRLQVLQDACTAVSAAGEPLPLAALLFGELVDEQEKLVQGLEERDVERAADERRRLLASICEMEGHAADQDGGWSDYGVSDLYRDTEAWARERVR